MQVMALVAGNPKRPWERGWYAGNTDHVIYIVPPIQTPKLFNTEVSARASLELSQVSRLWARWIDKKATRGGGGGGGFILGKNLRNAQVRLK